MNVQSMNTTVKAKAQRYSHC